MADAAHIVYLPGTSANADFWDPVRRLVPLPSSTSLGWPGLGDNPALPGISNTDHLAKYVIDTVERRGEPAVLVGQSLGAYIALLVALKRPDLVTHLVLAAGSAGLDRTGLGVAEPTLSEVVHRWLPADHMPLRSELAHVTAPTMLLWATNDAIAPLALGSHLATAIPHSTLRTFESQSHWFVHDYAEPVANAILSHLEG